MYRSTPIFRSLGSLLGWSNYAATCSNYDIQRFQKKLAICLIVKDVTSTPRQRGSPDAPGRTLGMPFGLTFAREDRR